MRKLKKFLWLNWKTKARLLEAFFFLGWARFLKWLPFSKVSPYLGEKMAETTFTEFPEQVEVRKQVSEAVHWMSHYTFWESQCLVKAIAGQKMLAHRNVESTIYLGTAKDENGKFVAHAWLRSGTFFVSGSEGMEKYTVIATFAKKLENIGGENDGLCVKSGSYPERAKIDP